MKSLPVVIAALLAGCLPGPEIPFEERRYVAVFPPFATAEDCIRDADDPRSCSFALTFCKNGLAARRMLDVTELGHYYLTDEGRLVNASLGQTEMQFDVVDVVEIGSDIDWRVDQTDLWQTFLFETVDCL